MRLYGAYLGLFRAYLAHISLAQGPQKAYLGPIWAK